MGLITARWFYAFLIAHQKEILNGQIRGSLLTNKFINKLWNLTIKTKDYKSNSNIEDGKLEIN